MQFITHGPEVPEALLEAHEEGRVVFFCGAGISYPAGLPDFKGLVKQIYAKTGAVLLPNEETAFKRSRYDAVLDLLEHRIPGQRKTVRAALFDCLKPKWRKPGATDTHAALLALAKARDGSHRLVTTNFDRVFERAAELTGQTISTHIAPMLPIPKKSRWNGIVYLHGQLPTEPDPQVLNRLVVTSGDFGLSYLTERWAARFVGELFRNFVVCFVGYSINDPVLRYMMDALAADRMLGEFTPQAYALGGCAPGRTAHETQEWEAKGVKPILYDVMPGPKGHSKLHDTLKAWGNTYRDGVSGKEQIVMTYAAALPSASTKQDNYVGRMLWALSDESSIPAKRFADIDPVPRLEWLASLAAPQLQHADLSRYGITPRGEKKMPFSLAHRPSPYHLAPWMSLLHVAADEPGWDPVMFELARWLTRHLAEPELIIWIAKNGSNLHPRWKRMIQRELQERQNAEPGAADGTRARLSPQIEVLWRVILAGHVKTRDQPHRIYTWIEDLKAHGLTPSLRLELRELLAPKLVLKEPFRKFIEDESTERSPSIRDLADWDLELAADYTRSTINDVAAEHWQKVLPELIDDLQQLLRDALDLQSEMQEASPRSDMSYWHLPSILPHWQNRGYHEWVLIIELLRDAWLATRALDPDRARTLALYWFNGSYPTFKRLALFAATQDKGIGSPQWVSWLLSDKSWWLWAVDTTRETMRLLVLRGNDLGVQDRVRLEAAILVGPPRSMFRDQMKDEDWSYIVDRNIWLRLAKLASSGIMLGADAAQRLQELSAANTEWALLENQRDEFTHWMSGTGDPDYEDRRQFVPSPVKFAELVEWLKKPRPENVWNYEDDWRKICRERFYKGFAALRRLTKQDFWPVNRWQEALQAWSDDSQTLRSWPFVAPLLMKMPNEQFVACARTIAWWLSAASKAAATHSDDMVALCGRLLAVDLDAASGITHGGQPINQPVTEAINHPIGHVAQALFNVWFARSPGDDDGLPADLRPLLTQLCDVQVERYRHGRVILAANLVALFRVDPEWTTQHLLPRLNWEADAVEAKSCWEGFLWSPRLYRPLAVAFKTPFLDTANHYIELGEHRHQYVSLLTFAALNDVETYVTTDFRVAVAHLPQDGLRVVARSLQQAMEGAGDQRADFWKNRVAKFWHDVWPKNRELASPQIADALAVMIIAATGSFREAFAAVTPWIQPVGHPDHIVERLWKSDLCRLHPVESLQLLRAIVSDDAPWLPARLSECLRAIAEVRPNLEGDPAYRSMSVLLRARGQN